jgi:Holliday junction resolvasome RuvABC ATP-dependent DNA helicase subunit
MKQGKLVPIHNVQKADECIDFLLKRPRLEMVGLGMLYGRPGLGKTTYARRIACTRGYVYIRLEATTTPKTFAKELLQSLYLNFGMGDYLPVGPCNTLYKQCIRLLHTHEDTVIIIDEIDYAFRYHELLGSSRDLVDQTLSVVILVGMQNAKDRLNQINAYYFDRCNYFYEFETISKNDIQLLTQEMMNCPCPESLVNYIHFNAAGNLRKAIKIMHMIELRSKMNPIQAMNEINTKLGAL